MNFFTQLMPIFVGSFMGLIFAIGVFYITENIKKKNIKKNLIKNLKNEFLFNIKILDTWKENCDKILDSISNGKKDCNCILRYSDYQSYFLNQAFQSGVLFELLDNSEIANLIVTMSYFVTSREELLEKGFRAWESGKIKPDTAFKAFASNKKVLESAILLLKEIEPKIK